MKSVSISLPDVEAKMLEVLQKKPIAARSVEKRIIASIREVYKRLPS